VARRQNALPLVRRCAAFLPYHDNEWGFPVSDDHRLFEN